MPTTPKGVWYPGPTEPFPPGFSGEGGFFQQLAESVDERLSIAAALAAITTTFAAVSSSENVVLDELVTNVSPDAGNLVRLTATLRYTATDTGSIGTALRGLFRVDGGFVLDGGGPATISSSVTGAKLLTMNGVVTATGSPMDVEVFGRSVDGDTVDVLIGSFLLVEDLGPAAD